MKKFELRWVWHHPLKWIRICWWHWTVAIVLIGTSALRMNPVFEPVVLYRAWPIVIATVGGAVALSALSPLDSRIQATIAAVLFGLSGFQITVYILAVMSAGLSSGGQAIALSLALHWFLMGAIALQWVRLSYIAGAWMAVEIGRQEEEEHVA